MNQQSLAAGAGAGSPTGWHYKLYQTKNLDSYTPEKQLNLPDPRMLTLTAKERKTTTKTTKNPTHSNAYNHRKVSESLSEKSEGKGRAYKRLGIKVISISKETMNMAFFF